MSRHLSVVIASKRSNDLNANYLSAGTEMKSDQISRHKTGSRSGVICWLVVGGRTEDSGGIPGMRYHDFLKTEFQHPPEMIANGNKPLEGFLGSDLAFAVAERG